MRQSEEAVKATSSECLTTESTPRGANVKSHLSDQIHPDYTCYSLSSNTTDRAIAIVIEAKMSTRATNVVPQVCLLVV